MGLGREGGHGARESAVPDLHATPEPSRAFLTEPSEAKRCGYKHQPDRRAAYRIRQEFKK